VGVTCPPDSAVAAAEYASSSVSDVKLQLKRAGVRLATLIEAAAAGTMPEHLLQVAP